MSEDQEEEPAEGAPTGKRKTWITPLLTMICVGVNLGLLMRPDRDSLEVLARFGYLPAPAVWDGGYWALVTSAFVHMEIWHLAFNMYWLWILGSRMELAIGWWRFLVFYLIAAFISSSFQLGFSGTTGIGASGVVYAIFGFMWLARRRYPEFGDIIHVRTVKLFMIWLVACVVLTHLDILQVGNAAHASGLVFGLAVAEAATGRRRALGMAGSVVLAGLALVPLFWCPWSIEWLSHQAYNAHVAKQVERARGFYDSIIEKDPKNSWAYEQRGLLRQEQGDKAGAREDYERARAIDPSIDKEE